jgi:hypothetical protein
MTIVPTTTQPKPVAQTAGAKAAAGLDRAGLGIAILASRDIDTTAVRRKMGLCIDVTLPNVGVLPVGLGRAST